MRWLAILLALGSISWSAEVKTLGDFEMTDQNVKTRSYKFPKAKVSALIVADHQGSSQLAAWIQKLHDRYGDRIDIDGVADVSMIPKPFHNMFREAFRKKLTYSVMLDWKGVVVKTIGYTKGVANIYLLDRHGRIVKEISGPYNEEALRELVIEIDRAITNAR